MDGLGARLKREVSSSWCKIFPKSPGCDASDKSSNGSGWGGNGGSSGGGNNKSTTSKSTAKATPTSSKTTSSSIKQSSQTTTSVRYVAATTTTPQAAPATTAAAAPVVQSTPDIVAAPPPTTTPQQQSAPESSTIPQVAASQAAVTIAPTDVSPSVSSEANTAVAAGAETASTPTADPGATSQSSADRGVVSTTSSNIPAATGNGEQKYPVSSSVPGTAVNGDGGKLDQGSGATTNKTPAIVGAIVAIVLVAIIAALIYRYRRSRFVQPVLLPFSCAKRRENSDGSSPPTDAQVPQITIREKTSRENLLGTGVVGATRQSPTSSVAPPYSPASPTEQWLAESQSPPMILPRSTYQPRGASREDGRRRVAIPREQRLVPLGDQRVDPSSLEAGFPIPPSTPASQRNSVSSISSIHTTREHETSRPYSTFSAGNESVASSGVLCPVMMAWPVPPTPSMPQQPPRSPLSSELGPNRTWVAERSAQQAHGAWPRHVAMYHDDNRM
ncbi:hypothetical protein NKR19_g18 [Coniochaeta hoffmannii]|uniref:Uncharacterized protein n=1 Tax=Coniochaeta hoffmannii TaxID=91930 RepID=A0AA38S9Z4_9PEZI|nr:hypothetical protein NKR19_g18 [Coniochaeta hoffmannii]